MRYIITLLVVLTFSQFRLIGQEVTFELLHYSVSDGLRDHRVNTIIEEGGYLWVGTNRGINRFDGYRFTDFEPVNGSPDIQNRRIQKFARLDDERIVVIHANYHSKDRQFHYIDFNAGTLQPFDTGSIAGTSEHSVEESMLESGFEVPLYTGEQNRILKDMLGNALELQIDDHSGPTKALLKMTDGATLDLDKAWLAIGRSTEIYSNNFADVIYSGSWNGMVQINIKRSPFTRYLDEKIQGWEYRKICRSIAEVGDHLFVSTEKEGPALIDLRSGKSQMLANEEDAEIIDRINNVRGTMVTQSGSIWTSAYRGYIHEVQPFKPEFREYRSEPQHAYLTAAPLNDSILVIAAVREEEYSLKVFNTRSGQFDDLNLKYFDAINEFRSTFILPTNDGLLWYGTFSGLFLVDLNKSEVVAGFMGAAATATIDDFGFPVSRNLPGSNVLVVTVTSDGNLWMGIENTGVVEMTPEGDIITFLTEEEGLPHSTVCGILKDASGFWLSTYNGLAHYDVQTKLLRSFSIENGLPHNEFNRFSSFISRDSTYYFGTMNGLVGFKPGEVLATDLPVRLLVSEVRYFDSDGKSQIVDRKLNAGSQITIPARSRSFSFDLALSDRNNPAKNTYAYKIIPEGSLPANIDWRSNGSNRTISVEYLPAGDYQVEFQGVAADGVVSNTFGATLVVEEYFYKAWWFIAVVMGALLILGYAIHRYRLGQVLKIERLRTKLSSDLHDDVGGLLSGVALQMELLEQTVDESNKPRVRKIAASSRSAMSNMRDVVWAIDSRSATYNDLVERIREFAQEVLDPVNIDFYLSTEGISGAQNLSTEHRHNILLITKEFITNSIKHAEASRVNVNVRRDGRTLRMTLQDNGRGSSGSNGSPKTGQGLRNIEMRTQRLGGELRYIEGPGFGLAISFPLG